MNTFNDSSRPSNIGSTICSYTLGNTFSTKSNCTNTSTISTAECPLAFVANNSSVNSVSINSFNVSIPMFSKTISSNTISMIS